MIIMIIKTKFYVKPGRGMEQEEHNGCFHVLIIVNCLYSQTLSRNLIFDHSWKFKYITHVTD